MEKKSYGFWTKENVFAEAKKYQTRKEFSDCCGSAYNVACKNNWLEEMDWFVKPIKKIYWSKERVFAEARKYKTKTNFSDGCGSAYEVARRNGWLDEMTWFKEVHKPNGFWTKEKVFGESKRYQTRGEFQNGSGRAYNVALKNGWLGEMSWLEDGRIKLFTDKIDCVYKYYFKETNSIYIGRTIDKNKRDNQHITNEKDTVYKYAKNNEFEIPVMEIIEDNLTIEEGLIREDYWTNYYKDNGYNVLNTAKTGIGCGSIGTIANGKWNKKSVFAEARKYQTKGKFQKGSTQAYKVALKKGWLCEMGWFIEGKKPNGFWTKENVFAEAKKYKTRKEFFNSCHSAYDVANRNDWLDEMDWFVKPIVHNKKWTKENVFSESKKYKTTAEFRKGCCSAYDVALKNGWLCEMVWLIKGKKSNGYWHIKDNTFAKAKKYKTRKEFQVGCGSAYGAARVNGWLDELFPKAV